MASHNRLERHIPQPGSIINLLFSDNDARYYIKSWLDERLDQSITEAEDHVLRQSPPPQTASAPCRLGTGRAWVGNGDTFETTSLKEQTRAAFNLALLRPEPLQLQWIVLGIWFADPAARNAVVARSPARPAETFFRSFEERITESIMGSESMPCTPSMLTVAHEQIRAKIAYESAGFFV